MNRVAQRFSVPPNFMRMPVLRVLLPKPVLVQPRIGLHQAARHVRAAVSVELLHAVVAKAKVTLRPVRFRIDEKPVDVPLDRVPKLRLFDRVADVEFPQPIVDKANPIRPRAVTLDCS